MGTLCLSWHKMDEPVDIFDTNYNYYEQPKPEKKSKGGRLRALRRMTQNAAKIATDMTRLVTGGDLIQKAIQNRHEYDDTPFGKWLDKTHFCPSISGSSARCKWRWRW